MCGIAGIISPDRAVCPLRRARVEAMRDRLAHRGPDGDGLFQHGGAVLGHRRLAVVDLTAGGAQPMTTRDGRFAISYNGELYNDAELRADLERIGVQFFTRSDCETLLQVLATWGAEGLSRCRGMYAFCFVDTASRIALLGRDVLGIKPLYYGWTREQAGRALAFASEPSALLQLPDIDRRPDPVGLLWYLTSARATLEERTLFRGIAAVRPGELLRVRYAEENLSVVRSNIGLPEMSDGPIADIVRESVRRHLRSDAPLCALLSGGLDSSIVAQVATQAGDHPLRTYCSGAKGATAPGGDDFAFARLVGQAIGSVHTEAPVTQDLFENHWQSMVTNQLVPLCTPNETAIYEVARVLRAEGHKVALSGEGADELFGGYDLALAQSAEYLAGTHAIVRAQPGIGAGAFECRAGAWLAPEAHAGVLTPEFLRSTGGMAPIDEALEREFEASRLRARQLGHNDPLQSHLIFQRRVNLVQLLQRLDTATMFAGVEGRTPFADAVVMTAAESLPMSEKYEFGAARSVLKTKIALRRAFGSGLPPGVVGREKASFPLPFQNWIGSARRRLLASGALREFVREDALQSVAAAPSQYWHLAWPLTNLAIWLDAVEAQTRAQPESARLAG